MGRTRLSAAVRNWSTFTVARMGDAKPEKGSLAPGTSGKLHLVGYTQGAQPHDAVALTAKDPMGREIWTWILPTSNLDRYRKITAQPSDQKITQAETPDVINVGVADLSLQFSKKSGLLAAVSRAGKSFSFVNGPRLVGGTFELTSLTPTTDGNVLILTALYSGDMKSVTYRIDPNGWLRIDYAYNLVGPHDFFGVGFDYPETNLKSMRFLGNGPSPVYQNRLAGGLLDVWDRTYNNTITGYPATDQSTPFVYPEFKGYYAGVRWIQLRTSEGPITALVNQDDLYVQVLKPDFPPANIAGNTIVQFPPTNLSFLHAIPPIGTKFGKATTTGPQGVQTMANGEYHGSISLYFGDIH